MDSSLKAAQESAEKEILGRTSMIAKENAIVGMSFMAEKPHEKYFSCDQPPLPYEIYYTHYQMPDKDSIIFVQAISTWVALSDPMFYGYFQFEIKQKPFLVIAKMWGKVIRSPREDVISATNIEIVDVIDCSHVIDCIIDNAIKEGLDALKKLDCKNILRKIAGEFPIHIGDINGELGYIDYSFRVTQEKYRARFLTNSYKIFTEYEPPSTAFDKDFKPEVTFELLRDAIRANNRHHITLCRHICTKYSLSDLQISRLGYRM